MEPFVAYLLVGIAFVLFGILSIRKGSQKKKDVPLLLPL